MFSTNPMTHFGDGSPEHPKHLLLLLLLLCYILELIRTTGLKVSPSLVWNVEWPSLQDYCYCYY